MGSPVLSDKQREEIRANYTGRHGEIEELTKKYGVSRSTIIRVLKPERADQERAQRKKYMAESYNHKYSQQIIFQIRIDPFKEPDLHAKILEVEASGLSSSRQQYVKNLIRKDIQNNENK